MAAVVRSVVGLAAVAALPGCTQGAMGFNKAGGTQQLFMQDRHQCLLEAQQNEGGISVGQKVVVDRGMFMSCMATKGYTPDPNGGQFRAPAYAEVQLLDPERFR